MNCVFFSPGAAPPGSSSARSRPPMPATARRARRGVVARLHDHAVQQLVDGDRLPRLDEHARAAGFPGALRDRHRLLGRQSPSASARRRRGRPSSAWSARPARCASAALCAAIGCPLGRSSSSQARAAIGGGGGASAAAASGTARASARRQAEHAGEPARTAGKSRCDSTARPRAGRDVHDVGVLSSRSAAALASARRTVGTDVQAEEAVLAVDLDRPVERRELERGARAEALGVVARGRTRRAAGRCPRVRS